MAKKKSPPARKTAEYRHDEKTPARPDVGTQPQFRKKAPPKTWRYDSSLSPALDWDGANPAREAGEALIADILKAGSLEDAKAAAAKLKGLSKPFLNWAGKAERLSFDVPTLPLFVHERLSTRAILETLKGHRREKQLGLFDLFADPQRPIHDQVLRAYEYQDDWVNRLILGDSLVVMNSLLHYESMGGQVQMIYMDPPYGVKFGSNFQPFVRSRDVAHGNDDDMTREPEMVQAYRDTWELGLHAYLTYLRDRLLLARELLTPSGSIFVQISDENLHHTVELLDEVFGPENRVSIIAFKKTGFASDEGLSTTHDFLIWYARSAAQARIQKVFADRDLTSEELAFYDQIELHDGTRRALTKEEKLRGSDVRLIGKPYARNPMVSPGWQDSLGFPVKFEDEIFRPPSNRHWATSEEGIERLRNFKRLAVKGNTLRFVRFFDDFALQPLGTVWSDTGVGGFVGDERLYVVQTDTRVVARCMHMTTRPGDIVFDPTCGSGTTAYVAEQWGRRWISCDTSRVPLALARQRLLTATFPWYELRDPSRGPASGFIYKRRQNTKGEEVGGIVPHITLKSIANEEPSQEEVLVDRPEEERSVTRVAGPFAVEATIPTAIDFDAPQVKEAPEETGDFVERMLEVLRRSPVLRLEGNRTVTVKNLRRPAKTLSLSAEGMVANGAEKAVAFVFGPENGAVVERLVYEAAREAAAKSYSHLYVIGFAIQPNARELVEKSDKAIGIAATYVQATPDLMMGDLLKNMRSSQIFSVCGLPEVAVRKVKAPGHAASKEKKAGAWHEVELLGLDVFDPATMEVRHKAGDDVPAWFLDTDYNGLSFHVSQAFFPRTAAWDNLKRALKGEYEDSVWDHLAGAVSVPFEPGEHLQIAVKVIDDRGNELMVVKSLKELK